MILKNLRKLISRKDVAKIKKEIQCKSMTFNKIQSLKNCRTSQHFREVIRKKLQDTEFETKSENFFKGLIGFISQITIKKKEVQLNTTSTSRKQLLIFNF
jgi:hypothetical protein